MAQICSAFMPTFSGVEKLTLRPNGWIEMLNDEIDGTTWHDLLRPFCGVKELFIDYKFEEELSRALEVGEIGLDPGFLSDLQELEWWNTGEHADFLFGSFIHARRLVGRPISSRLRNS